MPRCARFRETSKSPLAAFTQSFESLVIIVDIVRVPLYRYFHVLYRSRPSLGERLGERQAKPKAAAAGGQILKSDGSPVSLDDRAGGGQTESGTLGFRGEEWTEQLLADGGGDPRSRIGDAGCHRIAVGVRPNFDLRHTGTLRGGVDGVLH